MTSARISKTGKDLKFLFERFNTVRNQSLLLTTNLSAEDQCIQSMPDASPTKWHLAHTTWFFETFILKNQISNYQDFDPAFNFLFNSYYEQIGERHSRDMRGLLTRPSLQEVKAYRDHVNENMTELFKNELKNDILDLVELGLHHEQQHQELILTDIKHALSCNPTFPKFTHTGTQKFAPISKLIWLDYPGGLTEIGWNGTGFYFDCESPRHKIWLEPYRLGSRLVTNGEYLAFIEDNGYKRPELWLSTGWVTCQKRNWKSPAYWHQDGEGWKIFTLSGLNSLNTNEPVCHISHFEADAYARWANKRLPTEAEWEIAANSIKVEGNFANSGLFNPSASSGIGLSQIYGDVWEWTSSPYTAYPGFKPAHGAIGEYNGKFMSGQIVLRGGSCATPEGHIRSSYRNFFYPPDRWQFTGIRLADDFV